MSAEIKARDAQIVKQFLDGKNYSVLGRRYQMHPQSIRRIIHIYARSIGLEYYEQEATLPINTMRITIKAKLNE